jgi:hypothetical protein
MMQGLVELGRTAYGALVTLAPYVTHRWPRPARLYVEFLKTYNTVNPYKAVVLTTNVIKTMRSEESPDKHDRIVDISL